MAPIAAHTITAWNKRISEGRAGKSSKGLIAVAFDQRNHGSREVDKLANEAWRQGNERHAIDMYSVYQGTAMDTSLLINHLESYTFPTHTYRITTHLVLGISLGAHAAWHCLLQDPRISAAAIIVGCPDYTALMSQRAMKSKRKTWTSSKPAGSHFVGSADFPPALVEAVKASDPAGLLMRYSLAARGAIAGAEGGLDAAEHVRLRPLFEKHLRGKKILVMSGGADKLVPYECGQPFYSFLKKAVGPGGWFTGQGVVFEDLVYEGVGHAVDPRMADRSMAWVGEVLTGELEGGVREAKI
ncbi:hypothetical protein LTS18_003914 [Coniosporium uncinatum]|uniref:Uncharacterized protein n=1 Tax=Coniosporium uncinatum TaxID=93489 RepID=A0ACC3D6M5_9PEZI|nr:hypothetical protein LTS18_003914 [Coniosporium uncinatum]